MECSEITVVKQKPDYYKNDNLSNCGVCGCSPMPYLAKDEFGDFLYPIFCSNGECERAYHESHEWFPMMDAKSWNSI